MLDDSWSQLKLLFLQFRLKELWCTTFNTWYMVHHRLLSACEIPKCMDSNKRGTFADPCYRSVPKRPLSNMYFTEQFACLHLSSYCKWSIATSLMQKFVSNLNWHWKQGGLIVLLLLCSFHTDMDFTFV